MRNRQTLQANLLSLQRKRPGSGLKWPHWPQTKSEPTNSANPTLFLTSRTQRVLGIPDSHYKHFLPLCRETIYFSPHQDHRGDRSSVGHHRFRGRPREPVPVPVGHRSKKSTNSSKDKKLFRSRSASSQNLHVPCWRKRRAGGAVRPRHGGQVISQLHR